MCAGFSANDTAIMELNYGFGIQTSWIHSLTDHMALLLTILAFIASHAAT